MDRGRRPRIKAGALGLVVLLGWLLQAAARGEEESAIKVSADFRYRHEMVKAEGQDAQNMHRIRGRMAVQGNANPWLKVAFRVSTGSPDPTTLMQTLDGGFSDKPVYLDLAYFDASPVAGVRMMGGKVPYPFVTTSLLWDGDATPEGLALKLSKSCGAVEPLVNAGFFWVEERPTDEDSYLLGGQAGAGFRPRKQLSFLACGGISKYTETEGRDPFCEATKNKGNSVDSAGHYVMDYNEAEAYLELGTAFGPVPVQIFANYVTNTEADSLNKGFLAGIVLGKTGKPNTWQMSYDYRRLERDAVIGAFTDSDPWVGGTDGENHLVQIGYELAANTQAGIAYYMGTNGLEDDAPSVNKLRFEVNFRI